MIIVYLLMILILLIQVPIKNHLKDLNHQIPQNRQKQIDKDNQKIIQNSILMVLGYFIIVSLVLGVMYYFGHPFSLVENVKEGMFILFFIFLVEFSFTGDKSYDEIPLEVNVILLPQGCLNPVYNSLSAKGIRIQDPDPAASY